MEDWVPYTDGGLLFDPGRKSLKDVQAIIKSMRELSMLVNDALYVLYTPGGELNSQKILAIFTEYLEWYKLLPDVLRLGQDFTPQGHFVQWVSWNLW